jgi:hypothetical protein
MQTRAPHSGRRKASVALVILLAVAALGLFAAGVALLGTDPNECSATAKGRRLEEVPATAHAQSTRTAAIDRPPHPPAAEASATHAVAAAAAAVAEAETAEASSSRRRRLCAASDCTELTATTALFDAMRVDILSTGDAKVVDLIAAMRTFIPFNKVSNPEPDPSPNPDPSGSPSPSPSPNRSPSPNPSSSPNSSPNPDPDPNPNPNP